MTVSPVLISNEWPQLLLLVVVGAVASAINAVAGGGSLISFPVLVGMGVPAVEANASNAVSLWPGSLSSAVAFLNQLDKTRKFIKLLFVPTVAGSLVGALLLVSTSQKVFGILVPILILMATVLLLFQPRIKRWVASKHSHTSVVTGAFLQFLVSVYGGYFGAGMGILMLAAFGLFMEGNIHELNAVKTWLGLIINFAASVMFVIKGLVWVGPALALMLGAIIGGYIAARLSQRVESEKLRHAIVAYGFLMVGWFVWRAMKG